MNPEPAFLAGSSFMATLMATIIPTHILLSATRLPLALKKSELYSSLWKSCDELRGGVDVSQYKDFVLILLFVKYVSDKCAGSLASYIKGL